MVQDLAMKLLKAEHRLVELDENESIGTLTILIATELDETPYSDFVEKQSYSRSWKTARKVTDVKLN